MVTSVEVSDDVISRLVEAEGRIGVTVSVVISGEGVGVGTESDMGMSPMSVDTCITIVSDIATVAESGLALEGWMD